MNHKDNKELGMGHQGYRLKEKERKSISIENK